MLGEKGSFDYNFHQFLQQEIDKCKKQISVLRNKIYNDNEGPYTDGYWNLLQIFETRLDALRQVLELYDNPIELENFLKKGN